MKKTQKRSECPISRTLDLFGDKWTLLIIRDIAFKGHRFYNEFLDSDEGIATNVLSDRLKMLETKGFLVSKKYEQLKTKKVYTLTDEGIGLIPLVLDMLVWGYKFDNSLAVQPGIIERIENDRDNFIAEIVTALKNYDAKNFC
ncbi:MAG: transcriptional regulator [Bacteroidetes bacterium]|nr:MAG: transcriptional regulator [Bacteroidota bacterium]